MHHSTSGDAAHERDARDAALAGRIMWASFGVMVASVGIGLPWDAAWHTTRPFETAFSPPHLYVYVTTALTVALYLVLLVRPRLRRCFGTGFAVPGVPFSVPGPLALAGGGLAILALGAALDTIWHSAFGLDETGWSAPHAMLGWGWGVAALGFVACRFALRAHHPIRWWTRLFAAVVVLGFLAAPVMGPLRQNQTVEKVRAVAAIPVLAGQPAFQRTARIYERWRLTRANPLFVVLGGVWVGVVIVALRGLGRSTRFVLLLATTWTLLSLAQGRGTAVRLGLGECTACWLPVPLLPAALGMAAAWTAARGDWLAGIVGGAVFGAASQAVWPGLGPASILAGLVLGPPAVLFGGQLGRRLAATLEQPTAARCRALVAVAVAMPLVTGAVDLILRRLTP